MSKQFTYRFSDNSEIYREATKETMEEIRRIESEQGIELVYNGFEEFMGVGRPSTVAIIGGSNTRGDGFKTGWNAALGMEIKTPSHYKQVLREKGLREVGNEKPTAKIKKKDNTIAETVVKEAQAVGANLSGQEIEKVLGNIK